MIIPTPMTDLQGPPLWVLKPGEARCAAVHQLVGAVDVACDLPKGHPDNIAVQLRPGWVVEHTDHANRIKQVAWTNPRPLKRPSEWAAEKGIRVVSPDGWHAGTVAGFPGRKGVRKRISEREFDARAAMSTIELVKSEEVPVPETKRGQHTHTQEIPDLRKHATEVHGWGTTSSMPMEDVSRVHHAEHGYGNLPYPPTRVAVSTDEPMPAAEALRRPIEEIVISEVDGEAYTQLVALLSELVNDPTQQRPTLGEVEAVIALAGLVRAESEGEPKTRVNITVGDEPMALTLEKQMATIAELSEERDELRASTDHLADAVMAAQGKVAELRAELERTKVQANTAQVEADRLNTAKNVAEARAHGLERTLAEARQMLVELKPEVSKLVDPVDAVQDFLDWLRIKGWGVSTSWQVGPQEQANIHAPWDSEVLNGLVKGWYWSRHGQWDRQQADQPSEATDDDVKPEQPVIVTAPRATAEQAEHVDLRVERARTDAARELVWADRLIGAQAFVRWVGQRGSVTNLEDELHTWSSLGGHAAPIESEENERG